MGYVTPTVPIASETRLPDQELKLKLCRLCQLLVQDSLRLENRSLLQVIDELPNHQVELLFLDTIKFQSASESTEVNLARFVVLAEQQVESAVCLCE